GPSTPAPIATAPTGGGGAAARRTGLGRERSVSLPRATLRGRLHGSDAPDGAKEARTMNSVCLSSRWVVLGLLLLAPLASAKTGAKRVWMGLGSGQRARSDWGRGELVATGQAVPRTTATPPGQKQLLARRGAVLDAQRNLLEALEGVQVSSDSTMVNFMANDVVRTQVEGAVLAAVVTSESWDPTSEIYTVEMTIDRKSTRLNSSHVKMS